MARPLILIALLLGVMGVIFDLAGVGGEFVAVMNWAAIILLAVGVLTGR